MTKKSLLVVFVVVLLLVVAIGAQLLDGGDDPGVRQTDRDTVMDQAPLEPPSPPQPPAGRSGAWTMSSTVPVGLSEFDREPYFAVCLAAW